PPLPHPPLPAGTYVAGHCEEQNDSRKCLPCRENEFIAYPNDFSRCFSCQTCREDQVELSPCRATSNTQCACRNGTFCSPDHPCEMCQKCRPRCPKDEVELAPCTPHSDRQCGPPTGTFSGSSSKWGAAGGGERGWGTERPSGRPGAVWRSPERGRGSPAPLSMEPGDSVCSSLGGRYRTLSFQVVVPRTSYPGVNPRKNLVPVEGNDPVVLLRRSFDIFARDVPFRDWKRYGRALDLLENDLDLAEMNDRYSLEPFFQMLNTWQNRQGMNASVNTLLETLHQINLGGVAEDISCKLVQQGFFQYEVS
ncbi:TR10B factor, partial [Ardeotis kori]|nr:TR10B factor [Ardeotis kori]